MPVTRLALPAPKIDLEQLKRSMQAVHQNSTLLFTPQIQQALRYEVEYHQPQAQLAAQLLRLLARYEKRQRARQWGRSDSHITSKHMEWQAARMQAAEAV